MASWKEKRQILEDVIHVCAVLSGQGDRETATLPKNEIEMMLLTIAAESSFEHRKQIGGGPARGLMQMEPATALDTFRWLGDDKQTSWQRLTLIWFGLQTIPFFTPTKAEVSYYLEQHDPFSLTLGRLHYRMFPEAFPKSLAGLAAYWKQYWNTPAGAHDAEFAIQQWKACKCDRLMDVAMSLCYLTL